MSGYVVGGGLSNHQNYRLHFTRHDTTRDQEFRRRVFTVHSEDKSKETRFLQYTCKVYGTNSPSRQDDESSWSL